MKKLRLTDEQIESLKEIIEHFEKEDTSVRDRQIRTWRMLKLLWEGYSQVYYSEVAHDWKIWDRSDGDSNQAAYDKPINIFRAYLESIIAALSITIPPVRCFPDDADNPLDTSTAKAGDRIAELIYRHNDVHHLWLHALFVFVTEGMVGCYSYPKTNKSYGTYENKEYRDDNEDHLIYRCPNCNMELDDQLIDSDEFMPTIESTYCEQCQTDIFPSTEKSTLTVSRLVGITDEPKTRICMETYGGLNIKVPVYAKNQDQCTYLYLYNDINYADAIEKYKLEDDEVLDKVGPSGNSNSDKYGRWGRISPQYRGEYPRDLVTERICWLRPSSFNVLEDNDDRKELKKLFPNGVRVVLIDEEFIEAKPETLDDVWTLTHNPLSDYIHFDPLGLLLTSTQEITNDLVSLTLQTIEHGIPQTFVNPAVLDLKAYSESEAIPGGVIATKTVPSNSRIGDNFHEVKTATLSGEVLPFAQSIQTMAQMVSGALPSIFGGALEGTKTASEYAMSRGQALQRLQNTWKMLNMWWKLIFGKAIPMYINEMKDDEKDVIQDEYGNFINVFVRLSELEGKIGKVELESSENLPITWAQQKDIVMQLLTSGNPEVLAMLNSPENIPVMREAIGLIDFNIPGEDDRNAEYEEIKQLVMSEPIVVPTDPMMMQEASLMGQQIPPEQELPSIEPDEILDNHAIRFEIDRHWLISEPGRLAKVRNPAGYKNVLLHARAHFAILQQSMVPPESSVGSSGKPNELESKSTPIQGEQDVKTQ